MSDGPCCVQCGPDPSLLQFPLLPSFIIAWKNILMCLFPLRKNQSHLTEMSPSLSEVHPSSQGKHIREPLWAKSGAGEGDPGVLDGEADAAGKQWSVDGLRRKDRMTWGRPGGSHEYTHPCKISPWSRTAICTRKPWMLANENVGG